jgi:hypothetical protein
MRYFGTRRIFSLAIRCVFAYIEGDLTESGVGGETQKGLQPLRRLLALDHGFLVEIPARS